MADQWADFLISDVQYDLAGTRIVKVLARPDTGIVGDPAEVERAELIRQLEAGATFMTISMNFDANWTKGAEVKIVEIDGSKFLQTESNGRGEDNLGELPEF